VPTLTSFRVKNLKNKFLKKIWGIGDGLVLLGQLGTITSWKALDISLTGTLFLSALGIVEGSSVVPSCIM
jgi:hypothetical protein